MYAYQDLVYGQPEHDRTIAHTLRRLAGLLLDTPTGWLATLGVLWLVEERPQTGNAVFAALNPVTALLSDTPVNTPLLHSLVEQGCLQSSPARHGGQLYMLTPAGRVLLADLRRRLQLAGQQALMSIAIDLETCIATTGTGASA